MISVITNSRDDAKFENMSRSYAAALAGVEHEFVRTPDATGMCEGYNRAIARAHGDKFLFVHDDTEVLFDDFGRTVLGHFARFDVFAPVGATRLLRPPFTCCGVPYLCGMIVHSHPGGNIGVDLYGVYGRAMPGAQVMDGVFIAATRAACERIGPWDAATFPGWHMYDMDYSYRAHLAGLRCGIVCDLGILHGTIPNTNAPEKLTVMNRPEWREPAKAFVGKHRETLPPRPAFWRGFQTTGLQVYDRADAAAMMREVLAAIPPALVALPPREPL